MWTSAKRNTLTAGGISEQEPQLAMLRDVHLAIGSVLGRGDILQLPADEQKALVKDLLSGPQRVLIILDNLETVDDTQVVAFLRDLPSPAKAIVTSRHRIDIAFGLRLVGLPDDHAAELIRSRRRSTAPS